MTEPISKRIVPGAPPPAPPSKSQLKRQRKKAKAGDATPSQTQSPAVTNVAIPDSTSAALVEQAPAKEDVQQGAVAEELVANGTNGTPRESPGEVPATSSAPVESPIVDIIHKRIKAANKKINRMQGYASTDPSKLNDDQRRTLKTLPGLEAVVKELTELKKAVELHEAELASEQALKALEAEKAEAYRLTEAIAEAQKEHLRRAASILSFLRVHSMLSRGDPATASVSLEASEAPIIFSVGEHLLGEDSETKEEIVTGLMKSEGEFRGLSYTRILELSNALLTASQEYIPQPEGEGIPSELIPEEPEVSISVVATAPSGGFHFMQEDELEQTTEENTDWVNVPNDQPEAAAPVIAEVVVAVETVEENGGNEFAPVENGVPEGADVSGAIDWANEDEEGGLPSLAGLHAKFGTSSGGATPDTTTQPPSAHPDTERSTHVPLPPSSQGGTPQTPTNGPEDDGFTPFRGGRGRSFRGGFRGQRGTGFRGAEFHRGGERGGRGYRGGGDRGGFRGGRGGASDGNWRGGGGGGGAPDGEYRGRGRGRGRGGPRGGFSENRGGAPAAATP